MNRLDLRAIMATVTGGAGYSKKGRLFWKRGPQLTKLIDLQASRWGKGVYVNFGVLPNEMVIGKVPPGVGYAGISERGDTRTARIVGSLSDARTTTTITCPRRRCVARSSG